MEDCQHSHHRLLHGAPRIFIKLPSNSSTEGAASKIPKKNDSGAGGSAGSTYCYTCAIREKDKNWSVLLAVVPITIWSGQQRFDTFGLLDTGSEITLILNHTADILGLEGEVEMIRLGTFHGKDPLIPARNVNLSFKRWRRRIRADNVERRQHCASEQPIVLSKMRIRCILLCIRRKEKPIQLELHAFSDASENGYGACV